MKKNELRELRCKSLLEHLMRNAIGYENSKSANDIIDWFNRDNTYPEIKGIFHDRRDVERTVQELRKRCNRKIGSSLSGYWMMTSTDEKDGYEYLKNQALAKMITAIKSGVDPRVFYKVLNEIKPECNNVADGQITLEQEETKRYSDDIQKIKEEIFDINLADHVSYEDNRRWDELLNQESRLIEKEQMVFNG